MYTIYGRKICPNCDSAKNILTAMGLPFTYIDIDENATDEVMSKLECQRSLPIIFADYGQSKELVGTLDNLIKRLKSS